MSRYSLLKKQNQNFTSTIIPWPNVVAMCNKINGTLIDRMDHNVKVVGHFFDKVVSSTRNRVISSTGLFYRQVVSSTGSFQSTAVVEYTNSNCRRLHRNLPLVVEDVYNKPLLWGVKHGSSTTLFLVQVSIRSIQISKLCNKNSYSFNQNSKSNFLNSNSSSQVSKFLNIIIKEQHFLEHVS